MTHTTTPWGIFSTSNMDCTFLMANIQMEILAKSKTHIMYFFTTYRDRIMCLKSRSIDVPTSKGEAITRHMRSPR
jgi:hypothetical protein